MNQSQKLWFLAGALGFLVLLTALEPILAPFLVGMLLGYLGDPWADKLEARGISRTWAAVIVFSVISLIVLILLLLWVPMIIRQANVAVSAVPEILLWIQREGIPYVQQLTGIQLDMINVERIKAALAEHWLDSKDLITGIVKSVTKSGLAFFAFIGNLALIPVVAFYLLRDWDILVAKILNLFPSRYQTRTKMLATECDEVLGAFLRGQLLVMLALSMIYAVGLWIVGLDLALLVGLIAGLASIVPYLGFVVGIIAATVAGVMQFGLSIDLVWIGLVFGFGQAIEGMVLTPLLVGDRIGLHPVAVIFAILAGGQLFGFVGVLIALPVAAVIMVFIRHIHDNYKESEFYRFKSEDGAEDSPS